MNPQIYNCHVHTFTLEHVLPDRLMMPQIIKAMRIPWLRKFLLLLVGRVFLRMGKDAAYLTNRFLARGALESQEKIFSYLQNQYPENTRFIILPMDFEFTGIGRAINDYENQLRELAQLRDRNKQVIFPFCAVDPRRPNIAGELERWHREYGVKGIKVYPNLGYYPNDPSLLDVYAYCQKHKLPVMAHCSPGGVRQIGITQEEARQFAHPDHYKDILREFPKLNICLAHFGGSEEWERHLTGETPRKGTEATWLTVIMEMIRSGKYPNLFTDVSYTLFTEMPSYRPFNYFNFLNVLLEDEAIRGHVLFGTDYYMVEREKVSEKEVSIALRAHLGEKLYFQIAYHNPRRYLYEGKSGRSGKPAAKTGRKTAL